MEFIKDITVTIDRANYGDSESLKEILSSYACETTSSSYKVRGSFEKLKSLVDFLLSANHGSSPATQGTTGQRSQRASAHGTSVTVSALVMKYIQLMCAEKLERIRDTCLIIEKQSSPDTVQVTFRTQSGSVDLDDRVRLDFVKQRFISFYQRTASDLQVTHLSFSPHQLKELQRKFPLLLFESSAGKTVTVMGPFASLHKLKARLSQSSPNISSSPVSRAPERSRSPSLKHRERDEDESCPICMETIRAGKKKTLKCKHSFCSDCVGKAFDYKPVCPICGEVYGILRGVQPDGGTMKITQTSSSLPGYDKYGTIIISYDIPSGIQKEEHPNPGQPFEGVSRKAFLPNSPEGKKILRLLERAFDQRLIFTIGQSTTSGRSNVVTWNDIHHKTSTQGGPTLFGYPDPEYLRRVREELKVKGIE
ncbi:E3 ubiquitin-protein ligase DTX3L [Kryptolebias marmoratus]|uniref:E3 ubiquitin-protein ligase n=1 Tax=Kryptolebias marmoratus TaxID=37003 RepID=A0A3Q3B6D0_KRYMA|nr:E3 ubiquitin-protein ligase DTX3L [Kryptolebias marmoratus]XP_037831739.1 E3 ubiquitin-protein ligase DTX3L [Kryptolebias marmoratus]